MLMQKITHSITISDLQQPIPIKNTARAYLYCVVLCISTVYSGYSLTLISSTSTAELRAYYHIQAPQQVMASLLNGILPVGAMLGCLVLPYFLRIVSKKNSYYVLFLATFVQCGLSIIPSFQSLIISRFLLGVLNAFYTSISAIYIKEVFPYLLRKPFGAIYSCGRIVGILICYSIAEIFHYPQNQVQHILVFQGPAFLALVQAVLVFFCIPHSPVEMLGANDDHGLYQSLQKLYRQQDIGRAVYQLKKKMQIANRKTVQNINIKLAGRKDILSYHLALLRQFCGATFIVIYARQVMVDFQSPLADDSPVIINGVQLFAGLIGIGLVTRLKRRFMVIFSNIALAFLTLAIAVSDLYGNSALCLAFMTLFMIPCGACLTSVIWSYPSELASKQRGKYSSFLSWAGAAVMTLVPPYIIKAMPNNSAYPIFFFFSLYLCISFIVNYFVLVQVEDLKSQMLEMKDQQLLDG